MLLKKLIRVPILIGMVLCAELFLILNPVLIVIYLSEWLMDNIVSYKALRKETVEDLYAKIKEDLNV
jgi:hypothetical protein